MKSWSGVKGGKDGEEPLTILFYFLNLTLAHFPSVTVASLPFQNA